MFLYAATLLYTCCADFIDTWSKRHNNPIWYHDPASTMRHLYNGQVFLCFRNFRIWCVNAAQQTNYIHQINEACTAPKILQSYYNRFLLIAKPPAYHYLDPDNIMLIFFDDVHLILWVREFNGILKIRLFQVEFPQIYSLVPHRYNRKLGVLCCAKTSRYQRVTFIIRIHATTWRKIWFLGEYIYESLIIASWKQYLHGFEYRIVICTIGCLI